MRHIIEAQVLGDVMFKILQGQPQLPWRKTPVRCDGHGTPHLDKLNTHLRMLKTYNELWKLTRLFILSTDIIAKTAWPLRASQPIA